MKLDLRGPLFEVTVAAHRVGRHDIAEQTVTLGAKTAQVARQFGLIAVHIREGVPSWRPYLRASWPHTSVSEVDRAAAAVGRLDALEAA